MQPLPQPLSPEDLRRIHEEHEVAKLRETLAKKHHADEEREHLHVAFLEKKLKPETLMRFNSMVQRAAEADQTRVEILRFPSQWCNDRGRRINNLLPDWPESLEGYAKRIYLAWDHHLRKIGYKMSARVLSYQDGIPGEVALYIEW